MSVFTEVSEIDSINVIANNNIEVRRADRVLKDGVEISKTYHRHVLSPGDDLTNQDSKVTSIANIIWTPEVIQNYLNSLPVPLIPEPPVL